MDHRSQSSSKNSPCSRKLSSKGRLSIFLNLGCSTRTLPSGSAKPDYAAFFAGATELIEAFEAQKLSAPETSKRIFDLANHYPFPVVIRRDAMTRAGWIKESDHITERDVDYARRGFRWALTNPRTRDLFGSSATFFRWCAHQPDPHLA